MKQLEEVGERDHLLAKTRGQDFAAAFPGRHQREQPAADQQRKPAAVRDLGGVGAEKRQIDDQEPDRDAGGTKCSGHFQTVRATTNASMRRDHHVHVDRDAVGRGQSARAAEAQHESDRRQHQEPVDQRDVDLADLLGRGVSDAETRPEAQHHRLAGDRKGAGDQRLRCDRGRQRGEHDHRVEPPGGHHVKERMLDRFRVVEQVRALTEVVQNQRRHNHPEPGHADRPRAEMADVRVQRFSAGDDEKNRSQHQKSAEPAVGQKLRCPVGVERREHLGTLHDVR